ncbi:alpha/beta hydrolase family protein [Asticcacaulis taihuensis]|uniref:Dipeptidyl aminopeptidase/acylaminoacyl peptidase n=1 Tax=Asticcacaulis taihuensis TaxID=260084 RepID=A0A1G4R8E6_9CAUL|nr:alpha/beta fold hydrolase [Asticcacaulis taihuensis]SCW53070.1 Dipeptidyl aminopeptidase/acylaminoacyl peptidase [Asticcacaulis taihuensis]
MSRIHLAAAAAGISLAAMFFGMESACAQATTEVVVKGALRPRPVDAPPPIDVFVKRPRIEQVALSQDGSQIAFVTWVESYRALITYRVADKSNRVVKLNPGTVSAISWADDDHVLISTTRTGLRGTCEGVVQSSRDAASSHINRPETDTTKEGGAAEAMAQLSLMESLKTPGCVYYGIRAQTAVTSVNVSERAGTDLGARLSEYANLALGTPEPVMVDGKVQLIGPYLELRQQSMGGQPTQRVYLWRSDPQTGLGKLVDDGGGDLDREHRYVDDWLLDRQGNIIARSVYNFTREQFTLERKVDGKWKPALMRKIETRATAFAPFMAGLGRDGQSIVIFDAEPGSSGADRRFHYYELAADGKLSAPLEPGDATRDRPIFNPETGRLAGFVQTGEAPEYSLTDPLMRELYRKAQDAAPGQAVTVVSTARDPHRMIIFAQGGEEPGAYHFIDFTTGKTLEIGDIHPEVPSEWVASQKSVSYKASDGLEIGALLTLPPKPEPKRLPLIVLPHDGPQAHDSRGFDWLAQVLASRGYLVLQPNYRGSDGAGPAFMAAGQGQWGRRMQSDLADGVRYLADQGLADPARVCIIGNGYGGYAALEGATMPETWRCAASLGGISDIGDYVNWVKSKRSVPDPDQIASLTADPVWPRAFSPDPGSAAIVTGYLGDPSGWSALSPRNQVADIKAPVLLVHQTDDRSVPVRQSKVMRDALQAAGKAVTYTELPGSDHELTTEEARLATAEAVLKFLQAYNPAN